MPLISNNIAIKVGCGLKKQMKNLIVHQPTFPCLRINRQSQINKGLERNIPNEVVHDKKLFYYES